VPLAHVTLVRAASRLGAAPLQRSAPRAGTLEREALEVVEVRGWLEGGGEDGFRPFVVELAIEDGWHLNANPAGQAFLVPLGVSAPEGRLRRVRYPPGEPLDASTASEPIQAYRGRVQVRGEIAGAGGPAVVNLTYQACDASRCLPPATREVALAASAPASP
jgi:hypothetical protein